ncbi:fimbrial biogenesis outer membrane usher protein [Klebsiella aerogenes]|nr:fimbrial biogenesis outer membrane usher protein [Klebsiella aerogenes]
MFLENLFINGKLIKISPLVLIISSTLYSCMVYAVDTNDEKRTSVAQNVDFNALFLNTENGGDVDLSRFANGAAITPGTYNVTVYVNDAQITTSDVLFKDSGNGTIVSCLDYALIKQFPLKFEKLDGKLLASENSDSNTCSQISEFIPDATEYFDSNEQKLYISIPQIYIEREAQGSVRPALWDSGIPAGILGYTLNQYFNESNGRQDNSLYAGFNAGINIGSWYFRHNGNYMKSAGVTNYDASDTYLQHDIPAISGRMLIGQSNTSGIVFDTLPFSGGQLASDDRMLPQSQRGYAPDIRGIARTNARVTISQNGRVIREVNVSPGEFLINDMYPSGYGGDLDVKIYEADGTVQTFSVAYSSVTQLLRPGLARYSVTGGRLNSPLVKSNPELFQLTYQRGLTNLVTAYGGTQIGDGYYSAQFGGALGTPLGALSLDITHARTILTDEQQDKKTQSEGQSYRVSYSKIIAETNSQISLAAYRFSTSGYMDFITAMQAKENQNTNGSLEGTYRVKNRYIISLSQSLSDGWGQFYASGSMQDYWNSDYTNKQYQIGYNNRYRSISYGISGGRTYDIHGHAQDSFMLSMFFPLGGDDNRSMLRLQAGQNSNGQNVQQAALSGSVGNNNQFNYSVITGNTQDAGVNTSINGQYTSQYTTLSTSYGTGRQYRSSTFGMMGSLVAHSGGITLSPYISDTFALVDAEGATGAKITSYPGIYVDSFGYALVPYLNPYQMNSITIDPGDVEDDVEFSSTEQKVAPYDGAIVKLKYTTNKGTPVLINATTNGVDPVPFGADVLDDSGRVVGVVGQSGQVYARVAKQSGILSVRWGNASDKRCLLNYRLIPVSKSQQNKALQTFNQQCKPVHIGGGEHINGDAIQPQLLSMNKS